MLTFWKEKLSDDLGFDFQFKSEYGTMEQDQFKGEEGNALDAFFIGFAPEIAITQLTDEINAKNHAFLTKAAQYISNSKESEVLRKPGAKWKMKNSKTSQK